jgi:phytoene dehydrogenase-like protein
MSTPHPDAVIVGSGPNGLAAAIHLARQGLRVRVIEGADTLGGGMRTHELTLPGFKHDMCSAIHPLGVASPFMRSLPLHNHGLRWVYPAAPAAHPLDGGQAVMLEQSLKVTAQYLGADGKNYARLFGPFVRAWEDFLDAALAPLRYPPAHMLLLARFGLPGVLPARALAAAAFEQEETRAAFAGMAAHSVLPMERPLSAAIGMVLTILAHAVGWPMAQGGSQSIADAMASYLRSLGGEIETGHWVRDYAELPPSRLKFFDVPPRTLLRIMGDRLPPGYRRTLQNFTYGPGVFKIDYALSEPIPWANPQVSRAGTVHVGGTMAEIARSERAIWQGKTPQKPYVLLAQHTLFDATRAPEGQHTAWAYCHVPNSSPVDMTQAIEDQIERFAPGFRDTILTRSTRNAPQMEAYNPNYVGGDVNAGAQGPWQIFRRPVLFPNPYRVPVEGVYLCGSSTPPGGGVHGMAGYWAARYALAEMG